MRDGQAKFVFVEGASGTGKSVLVEAFVQQAIGRGAVVLNGRCYEMESVPFKAIDSLVDSLVEYLGTYQLFMLDRVEEAAVVFQNAYHLPKGRASRTPMSFPFSWLASALRRQAEKTSNLERSNALLKRAGKVAKNAVRVARTFQNELPHALREAGLIASMQGSNRRSREVSRRKP